MKKVKKVRKWLSVPLACVLVVQSASVSTAWPAQAVQNGMQASDAAATATLAPPPSLSEIVTLPSLEVASLAEKFIYSPRAIQERINALDQESKKREAAFKASAKRVEKQVAVKEKELSNLQTTTTDAAVIRRRQLIHCQILALEKQVTDQTFIYLQQQISADVQVSKLRLLQNWPAENRQVEALIAQGTVGQRRFGNVLDIGRRGSLSPFRNQQDDIAWGQKEIETARQRGQFPQEIKDPAITKYINRIAQNLAYNSDLQVPLHVFVVKQEVIKDGKPVLDKQGQPQQVANAMALPGGYLLIYAGLIQSATNESELAGVIAHEMAHIAARHARRMAKKGTVFNIASLAALIGLQLIAPGLFQAASYLGYYLKGLLLQAIFNGLGLVFTLNALGVSRDFELEADQLGMQYAWKTGYDPRGFIDLFDQMSQKEGYASRTSFFTTHPAFGQRILNSLKEYKILESINRNPNYIADTAEFQTVRERINASLYKTREEVAEEESRPSLNPKEPSEEECKKLLAPTSGPAGESPSASNSHPAGILGTQSETSPWSSSDANQEHDSRGLRALGTQAVATPCAAPFSRLF
jgi:Zn-dependent protease with chaperone function